MWIIFILLKIIFLTTVFIRRCVRAREMQGAEGEDEGVYSRK